MPHRGWPAWAFAAAACASLQAIAVTAAAFETAPQKSVTFSGMHVSEDQGCTEGAAVRASDRRASLRPSEVSSRPLQCLRQRWPECLPSLPPSSQLVGLSGAQVVYSVVNNVRIKVRTKPQGWRVGVQGVPQLGVCGGLREQYLPLPSISLRGRSLEHPARATGKGPYHLISWTSGLEPSYWLTREVASST